MENIHDMVIVGAGLSGVTLARQLKAQDVLLIDKAKSPGGRAATRRIGGIPVNHGLDQFSGSHPLLEELTNIGLNEKLLSKEGDVVKPLLAINNWIKLLAQDLQFQNLQAVSSVVLQEGIFQILDKENNLLAQAFKVVLATPAQQAYEILKESGFTAEFLKEVKYNSLVRHYVLLKQKLNNRDLVMLKETEFGFLYCHEVTSPFSEDIRTKSKEVLNLDFLRAFSIPKELIVDSYSHRWLYSQVTKSISEEYQTEYEEQKLFLTGDYFSLNGVEGAMNAVSRIALRCRT